VPAPLSVRTRLDLERAVRSLAEHFRTDAVVVVGSQSVLVGWPDAPVLMRTSGEIDAYPANARLLERGRPGYEVSEEIFALFGDGSPFEEAHGFYIDGVDDTTAKLPPGWERRAVYHETEALDGRPLRAIAPCTDDMIVSKLHRLVEKDRAYVEACHAARPLDVPLLKTRMAACGPRREVLDKACAFLDTLPPAPQAHPRPVSSTRAAEPPPHPAGTHHAFVDRDGAVYVREWDAALGIFNLVGNTLGPAVVRRNGVVYVIAGERMAEAAWAADPRVTAARAATRA